jgi:probable F420-dependent oxidoreductase
MVRISVQGRFVNRQQWVELAKTVDRTGFDSLYVADHLGTSIAPFAALAAAATVTERVRLGTCVLNAGLKEPLTLAAELMSLDALSGGRAVFGVGAGHTPAEWAMFGMDLPPARERVDRLIELVAAVRDLLEGESVTSHGAHFHLREARLDEPRKSPDSIPLLVGGNGRRLLGFAAQHADIVGVSGLGNTLPDGHSHDVEWSSTALDRTFDLINSESEKIGRRPDIEALVQYVKITDDREQVANQFAQSVPSASADEVLDAPFVWIGTRDQIAAQIVAAEDRWGINRYVIRDVAIEAGASLLEIFTQTN